MNNKDIDFRIDINDFNSSVNELLKNVKEDILDIEQVPIVEIIDQYLKYIIQNKSIIDLSVAGKTINEEEDKEDNDFIISKEKDMYLQEYEKYQKIVEYLKEKEGTQNDIYFPTIESNEKEGSIEIEKVDLADLLTSLEKVLQNNKKEEFIPFKKRIFTVATKMKEVINSLKSGKEGLPFEYFMEKAQSKLEIIVIFLALLELIYLQKIKCYQNKSFDKIIFNLKEGALNLKKN